MLLDDKYYCTHLNMSDDLDVFRKSFKYYKRKIPVPDFTDVIDFRHSSTTSTGSEVSYYVFNNSVMAHL